MFMLFVEVVHVPEHLLPINVSVTCRLQIVYKHNLECNATKANKGTGENSYTIFTGVAS